MQQPLDEAIAYRGSRRLSMIADSSNAGTLDPASVRAYIDRLSRMALTNPNHQVLDVLKRSDHTLVCFPEQVSGDTVASALGVGRAIEALRPGHQVDVVSSGFHDTHRARYAFLPEVIRVKTALEGLHQMTISVDLKRGGRMKDVRYDVKDDRLEIHLTPERGELKRDHIETALSRARYDLIVTVGCPDLAALGSLFTDHAEFFQSTPIVNIDRDPSNERYGQLNLVDLTAVACGEVCAHFLREVAPDRLDADVATCLLTGILAATRGLRHPRMGPRTFAVTATLIEAGARRDDIVRALFQTKTVGQLKLWGRALSRLRTDQEHKIVWTVLSQGDFLSAGAHEDDLLELIDELLVNAPDAQLILCCYELQDRTTRVVARSPDGRYDAASVLKSLGGNGSAAFARATLATNDLIAAERQVLDAVRGRIGAK